MDASMNRNPHIGSEGSNDRDVSARVRNADHQDSIDGLPLPADRELVAQGWVRRHLVAPDRAAESMDLYASLGFEVQALALAPDDFPPQCAQCASEACRSYVMIYTRRKRADSRRPPSACD